MNCSDTVFNCSDIALICSNLALDCSNLALNLFWNDTEPPPRPIMGRSQSRVGVNLSLWFGGCGWVVVGVGVEFVVGVGVEFVVGVD